MTRRFHPILRSPRLALAVFATGMATACAATALGAANTPDQVEGIPDIVLQAYGAAAAATSEIAPECSGMRWSILAGIGQIESQHSTMGGAQVGADGTASPPIIGIPLNGENNTQAITDTDQGRLDGDTAWDRAVGPMQFIPSTWEQWGIDGNGDGVADPQNVFDAAFSAVAYLCGTGPQDLTDPQTLATRIGAYNAGQDYLDKVTAAITDYDAIPLPANAALPAGGPVVQLGGAQPSCASMGAHPDMCHAHTLLTEQFGVFWLEIHSYRPEAGSDHNDGEAIDYMLAPLGAVPSPEAQASAVTIIDYVIANHRQLKVKGLIYDSHIWNARNDPVGPWDQVKRGLNDRGSITQNHVDHIHLAAGPHDMR